MIFSAPGSAQTTFTVAAAADLAPLQPALASSFGKIHPGVTVRFVSESSAALSQQIENGAPYDVFLSANAQCIDHLSSFGKIVPQSVQLYATGQLAMLWRDGKHHQLSDLTGAGVRFVALPNPKLAPYGVAAQEALEHAGIWRQVQPKVVYGENVRQALQLLESGNTDAVLTSNSLLLGKNATVIPDDWHRPVLQKAGIVAATKHPEAAQAFMQFLTGPGGRAIFAQFGFAH